VDHATVHRNVGELLLQPPPREQLRPVRHDAEAAGRVRRVLGAFLEHGDTMPGARQRECGREAGDAATDHDEMDGKERSCGSRRRSHSVCSPGGTIVCAV
jgi:hypothetical protein